MNTEIYCTPVQSELSESKPSKRPRRIRSVGVQILRFVRLFAAWTVCLATIAVGLVFFAPRMPGRALPNTVGLAALVVPWMTAPLLVTVLLTFVIVAMAWHSGRRALLTAGALASVLGLFVIVTPWWSARTTAQEHGASLSWSEFFRTPAQPSPTATRIYQRIENQDLHADIYRPQRPAPSRAALLCARRWLELGHPVRQRVVVRMGSPTRNHRVLDRLPTRPTAKVAGRGRRRQVRARLDSCTGSRLRHRTIQRVRRR